jgi:hypothetical protein
MNRNYGLEDNVKVRYSIGGCSPKMILMPMSFIEAVIRHLPPLEKRDFIGEFLALLTFI